MEKGRRRGKQQIYAKYYAKESASVFDFTERISGRSFSIVIRGPTWVKRQFNIILPFI